MRTSHARILSCASITTLGLLLIYPIIPHFIMESTPLIGKLTSGFALVLASTITTAGIWLYYNPDMTAAETTRVAKWNFITVTLQSIAIMFIVLYDYKTTGSHDFHIFFTSVLLASSAFITTILTIHDVNGIRAPELNRERQKLAVLNRILRHNLRNKANVIQGFSEEINKETNNKLIEQYSNKITANIEEISSFGENANQIQELIEGNATTSERLEPIDRILERTITPIKTNYTNATITIDAGNTQVLTNNYLPIAIEHIVKNAIEHNDSNPEVTITVEEHKYAVDIHIEDNGPGIPQSEINVVTGTEKITPTTHGSGFGLWSTKWILNSLNGALEFEQTETGTRATLTLPKTTDSVE